MGWLVVSISTDLWKADDGDFDWSWCKVGEFMIVGSEEATSYFWLDVTSVQMQSILPCQPSNRSIYRA
jgi:hypothetical protein